MVKMSSTLFTCTVLLLCFVNQIYCSFECFVELDEDCAISPCYDVRYRILGDQAEDMYYDLDDLVDNASDVDNDATTTAGNAVDAANAAAAAATEAAGCTNVLPTSSIEALEAALTPAETAEDDADAAYISCSAAVTSLSDYIDDVVEPGIDAKGCTCDISEFEAARDALLAGIDMAEDTLQCVIDTTANETDRLDPLETTLNEIRPTPSGCRNEVNALGSRLVDAAGCKDELNSNHTEMNATAISCKEEWYTLADNLAALQTKKEEINGDMDTVVEGVTLCAEAVLLLEDKINETNYAITALDDLLPDPAEEAERCNNYTAPIFAGLEEVERKVNCSRKGGILCPVDGECYLSPPLIKYKKYETADKDCTDHGMVLANVTDPAVYQQCLDASSDDEFWVPPTADAQNFGICSRVEFDIFGGTIDGPNNESCKLSRALYFVCVCE